MDRRRRRSITIGVLLVIIGGWFLAVEFYAPLKDWADAFAEWPIWIVAAGLLFFVAGLVGGVPSLSVPAAIISGIGGILYYQNVTGEWETWFYAWTLIPGFVGVGVMISNLLQGYVKRSLREGGRSILFSLLLFGIFGGLLHQYVGGPEFLGQLSDYWPALLILAGLWIIIRPLFKRKRPAEVV